MMKILLQQPIIHRKRNSSLNFTNVEQLSTNAHDKQNKSWLGHVLACLFLITCTRKGFLIHFAYFSPDFFNLEEGDNNRWLTKKFQNNASSLWHQVKLSIDCRLHVIVITKPQSLTNIISKIKKKLQIEIHISIYIYPSLFNLKNGLFSYMYKLYAVSSEVSFSVSALNFALSAPSYFWRWIYKE